MRLSRNVIIAIFSLFLITVIAVGVVLIIYFNSYIVTYDLNGGEMGEDQTRVWVGSNYSLPSPTKQGYAFAGWYLDGKYFPPEGVWELEEDVTLTAKWGLTDEHGVIYSKGENGYVIETYNGKITANIVLPLKYNGEPIVDIKMDALDLLKSKKSEVKEGFIKVYIPHTAISDGEIAYFEGILASRYSAKDESGFIYLENEDSQTLVGYAGNYGESIVIPSEYSGKRVDAIGDFAFYGTQEYFNRQLSDFFRILMPETVTSIGRNAFDSCNGIKTSIYKTVEGNLREIIDLSILFDWSQKVNVASGNDELLDIVTQIRPAFGWGEHSSANYYVRFNTVGGEIFQEINVGDETGTTIKVKITDTRLKKNKEYSLPIPTKEGYRFDGWYYGNNLVPLNGSEWCFDTHVELTAKWTEK